MNNELSFTENNDINNEKELKGVNENTINNVEENHSNLDSLEFSLEPLPELDDIDEDDSELFGGR